jgi:SOS-response transcriptional repressor LexA
MERPERDFKGVWIPREVWLSEELSLMEKVLFVEIHSLDNERGCFASNAYFAQFFAMSTRQIATHIAALRTKGYITLTIENHNERTIHVTGKYAYANPQSVRRLRREISSLKGRFAVQHRTGGMKKTSGEV